MISKFTKKYLDDLSTKADWIDFLNKSIDNSENSNALDTFECIIPNTHSLKAREYLLENSKSEIIRELTKDSILINFIENMERFVRIMYPQRAEEFKRLTEID
jgi:hypothetical protein